MANLSTIDMQTCLSRVVSLDGSVTTKLPEIPQDLRNILLAGVALELKLRIPHNTGNYDNLWRDALKRAGAWFNSTDCSWRLIIDSDVIEMNTAIDLLFELSRQGVVESMTPALQTPRMRDFYYDMKDWNAPVVCLSVPYHHRHEVKKVFPYTTWDPMGMLWEISVTAARDKQDLIDDNGWFAGARNQGISYYRTNLYPHKKVSDPVDTRVLISADKKVEYTISVHRSPDVLYVSRAETLKDRWGKEHTEIVPMTIQVSMSAGRRLWNALIACGFTAYTCGNAIVNHNAAVQCLKETNNPFLSN